MLSSTSFTLKHTTVKTVANPSTPAQTPVTMGQKDTSALARATVAIANTIDTGTESLGSRHNA